MVAPAGAAVTACEMVAKLGTFALHDPTANVPATIGCTASNGIAVNSNSLRRNMETPYGGESFQIDGTPHPRNLKGFRWDGMNRNASARGSLSWPTNKDVTDYALLIQREHRGGGFARHHCAQQYQMTSKLSITYRVQISQ